MSDQPEVPSVTDLRGLPGVPTPIPNAANFYIFSNNVSINIAFTAQASLLLPHAPDSADVVLAQMPLQTIGMSPQLAKEMVTKLSEAVRDYEQSYGEIPGLRARAKPNDG